MLQKFCLVVVASSLRISWDKMKQMYNEFHILNGFNVCNEWDLPDYEIMVNDDERYLKWLLTKLSDRQQFLIKGRMDGKTFKQLSDELYIGEERLRGICCQAYEFLRNNIMNDMGETWKFERKFRRKKEAKECKTRLKKKIKRLQNRGVNV